MKKNILMFSLIVATIFGVKSYFDKSEVMKKSLTANNSEVEKNQKKTPSNEYAVDMLHDTKSMDPVLAEEVERGMGEIHDAGVNVKSYKSKVAGNFDNKKRNFQVMKTLARTQSDLKRDELRIIDEEIKYDEMKLEEMIQNGDSQNIAYLEDIIAQKRERLSHLQ